MNLLNELKSNQLKFLINYETGLLDYSKTNEARECIDLAEKIVERMVGATLVVRGAHYILANLELYYGGIGDAGHDWYRYNYPQVTNKSRAGLSAATVLHQELEGPTVYIGRFGNHQRMDIVIGPKSVPISVLVRNVLDENMKSLANDWTGNTKIVLDRMGITHSDSGKKINENSDFQLIDTHDKYIKSAGIFIERTKRYIGKNPVGFEGLWGQENWNFKIPLAHRK
jgi:hypothetical protein